MQTKIPGFLEQLFDHENFEFSFDFHNEKVIVKKSQHNMKNLQDAISKILQENSNVLKEAYLKDIKKKFPATLSIDLKTLRVTIHIKDGLSIYSTFLSKILEEAVGQYNLKNFNHSVPELNKVSVIILNEFFKKHDWKVQSTTWSKDVKNAEQLQIIFSQVYHLLDDKTDLQKHIKSWKSYFKA